MGRLLIFMALLPLSLFAVGFQQIETLLIWYQADNLHGDISSNYWEDYTIAKNAPILGDKHPIAIISHGATGTPYMHSWLIEGLVKQGFIVLAVQHQDIIENRLDINFWKRAQDIHLALDVFSKSAIVRHADLSKIGFIGYSLGGTIGILLEGGKARSFETIDSRPEFATQEDYDFITQELPYLNCEMQQRSWTDKRIKAFVLLAPAWPWLFETESLMKIAAPNLIIGAKSDHIAEPKYNAQVFAHSIPKSTYKIEPGNHFLFLTFLDKAQRVQVDPNREISFIFDDDPGFDRKINQKRIAKEISKFLLNSLRED